MDLKDLILIFVGVLSGGAAGAVINEYLRRKRSRTQFIPLIERINQTPIMGDLRVLRLYRDLSGSLVQVKHLRDYQMTLRNTSETDLRNAGFFGDFAISRLLRSINDILYENHYFLVRLRIRECL